MHQEIKAKWITALRSGDYKQGTGQLKDGDKYCCLGVLCDLHAKETGNIFDGWVYLEQDRILPNEVKDWSEIGTNVGKIPNFNHTLWELNDVEMYSFAEIADVIEKHF